eukprot:3687658-Rhodomonas_salina.1
MLMAEQRRIHALGATAVCSNQDGTHNEGNADGGAEEDTCTGAETMLKEGNKEQEGSGCGLDDTKTDDKAEGQTGTEGATATTEKDTTHESGKLE